MGPLKSIGVLLAAALATGILARPPAPPARTAEGPLLPRASFLHAILAAQQNLTADYFWIQMLQQIGRAWTAAEHRDIAAYAQLTTDLDPKLAIVYKFGAVAIPHNQFEKGYTNTAESTALIRKGLTVFPDDPWLRFLLAHNLIFFESRFRDAAVIIEKLSKEPGAPPYWSALATRLYAQSGDFDAGLSFAKALRDSASDDETRAFFDQRIRQIEQERILQRLDGAITAFRERNQRAPKDLNELVSAGLLPTVPADPLGGQFSIDPNGRAKSSANDHRLEVYGDTQRDDAR